jgi:hypothetical protein
MQVTIAFVRFEVRFEFAILGDVASFVPDTTGCLAGDVPEFTGGESKRIKVVLHLLVVRD